MKIDLTNEQWEAVEQAFASKPADRQWCILVMSPKPNLDVGGKAQWLVCRPKFIPCELAQKILSLLADW
jgi:hypothetical protein